MALERMCSLRCLATHFLKAIQLDAFYGTRAISCHRKSTYSALPDNYNCTVELALTSDDRTVVCYHPPVEVAYEYSQPIPRPDPLENFEETHDQVLKAHLNMDVLQNKQAPTIEQLSKMFYTTKHRWYPVGQYHRRRRKTSTPKDR
ncbi:39S ribosomal protein L42, mitochondrial [Polypterus senegalus]|uniref:39S ribosomal protein L42, mitochondrial n=1 Tax=Polypterus senegalus TaxID=55291 RepID=UPI0019631618|nr:39S ribosomal protein L42, mitochondrial [Polypterus senegalus]